MSPSPAVRDASPSEAGPDGSGYRSWLAAILIVSLGLRLAYVLAQPATDPAFAFPMFDGAIYFDWARSLVAGGSSPAGAYYQAPLYPWALAAFLGIFGERFGLLYALQHLIVLATAVGLAHLSARSAGPRAGLWTAGLFLLYPPTTFFASRPLSETLALALLVGSLLLVVRSGQRGAMAGGLLAGLAALARPNLLLVPVAWAAGALFGGPGEKRRRTAWVLAGVALAVLPITVRNRVISGHWVPISSNAGMTAYHGNGPGASGVFTSPAGFSGSIPDQREEATREARRASGLPLDAVEADRWWGRQALRVRLADPLGSLGLVTRRAALLIDTHEHGLDYAPTLDSDPWRPTLRVPEGSELGLVPLALLLGLSGLALVRFGWRGSGGATVWLTIAACAAMPLLFYVSSRYRLPATALLAVPAGTGIAAIGTLRRDPTRRGRIAVVVGIALACLSLAIPSGSVRRQERAAGLANLAVAYRQADDLEGARRVAEQAVTLDPSLASAWYNLGAILEASRRPAEAEEAYRRALQTNPRLVRAACNLGGLLIRGRRADEAVVVLREGLRVGQYNEPCWTNLVVALVEIGQIAEARRALDEAVSHGVRLDAELVATVRTLASGDSGEEGGTPR